MPQNSVTRFQTFVRRFTTTPFFKNEIQIPKKIQRGPTDILKVRYIKYFIENFLINNYV